MIKTRSPLYLSQMSDQVKAKLEQLAKDVGVANWVVVESILEKSFKISSENNLDLSKFLGGPNKARTGKRHKKGA